MFFLYPFCYYLSSPRPRVYYASFLCSIFNPFSMICSRITISSTFYHYYNLYYYLFFVLYYSLCLFLPVSLLSFFSTSLRGCCLHLNLVLYCVCVCVYFFFVLRSWGFLATIFLCLPPPLASSLLFYFVCVFVFFLFS